MEVLKTHKAKLYVSILISISLTILFAFTIFSSGFLIDLPHSVIQITATSQKESKIRQFVCSLKRVSESITWILHCQN